MKPVKTTTYYDKVTKVWLREETFRVAFPLWSLDYLINKNVGKLTPAEVSTVDTYLLGVETVKPLKSHNDKLVTRYEQAPIFGNAAITALCEVTTVQFSNSRNF